MKTSAIWWPGPSVNVCTVNISSLFKFYFRLLFTSSDVVYMCLIVGVKERKEMWDDVKGFLWCDDCKLPLFVLWKLHQLQARYHFNDSAGAQSTIDSLKPLYLEWISSKCSRLIHIYVLAVRYNVAKTQQCPGAWAKSVVIKTFRKSEKVFLSPFARFSLGLFFFGVFLSSGIFLCSAILIVVALEHSALKFSAGEGARNARDRNTFEIKACFISTREE